MWYHTSLSDTCPQEASYLVGTEYILVGQGKKDFSGRWEQANASGKIWCSQGNSLQWCVANISHCSMLTITSV